MSNIQENQENSLVNLIWKDIPGYEGLYQVSNTGVIKAFARVSLRNHHTKERIVKSTNRLGYYGVKLAKLDSSISFFAVHRLVAMAFLPNPENKACVNHIDSNPANNNLSNLEWATYLENNVHSMINGTRRAKTAQKWIDMGYKPINPDQPIPIIKTWREKIAESLLQTDKK